MKYWLFTLLTIAVICGTVGCQQPHTPAEQTKTGDAESLGFMALRAGIDSNQRGEFKKGSEYLETAVANLKNPEQLARAHLNLGNSYVQLGQLVQAETAFTKVIQLGNLHRIDEDCLKLAYFARSSVYVIQGRQEKAEADLEVLKEMDPSEAQKAATRGFTEGETGIYILAIRDAITQVGDQDKTGKISAHLTEFFGSVQTIEEASIKALQEEDADAMTLIRSVLPEDYEMDPVVIKPAITYLKKNCQKIGTEEPEAFFAAVAVLMLVSAGEPALPQVEELLKDDQAFICGVLIKKKILSGDK